MTAARYWGGMALVLVSAIGLGVMAPAARLAYDGGANAQTVGALRFIGGGALLWLLAAATGRIRRLPRAKQLQLALMGGVGYTLHSGLFFSSIRYVSPGLAGVILAAFPAIAVLLSASFYRERLGPLRLLIVALCTAGAALAAGSGGGAADWRGIVLVALAATTYAAYIVVSRPVLAGVDPLLATAWIVTFSGIAYSLIAVGSGTLALALTPGAWLTIGVITVFSTVIAIYCFFLGIERVGPSVTAIVSSAEPAAAVVLSMWLFGERLGPWQWTGTALVLGGVMLQAAVRERGAGRPPVSGRASRPGRPLWQGRTSRSAGDVDESGSAAAAPAAAAPAAAAPAADVQERAQ